MAFADQLVKYRTHLAASAAAMLMYSFPIYAAIYFPGPDSADYTGYNPFVENMIATGSITRPNFLYPLILSFFRGVLGIPHFGILHLSVSLFFTGALAFLLVGLISSGDREKKLSPVMAWSAAIVTMLIGPILLIPIDRHEYFGYLMPTVFHNANMFLCKPFAVAAFYLVACLIHRGRLSLGSAVGMALLLTLSALSKPNFVLALLPAVGLLVLWRLYRRRPIDAKQVLLYVATPIAVVLGWQYLFTYISPGIDVKPTHVSFGWFVLWRDFNFLPKFFLSAAFPLCLAIAFREFRSADSLWQLAWVLFACALPINYLLVEIGQESHMNFSWTGQIAIFILFAVSMRQLLNVLRSRPAVAREFRFYAVIAVLLLHVAGGITWLVHESTAPGVHW